MDFWTNSQAYRTTSLDSVFAEDIAAQIAENTGVSVNLTSIVILDHGTLLTRVRVEFDSPTCESGWTGDRCDLPLFHESPHSNGGVKA